MKSVIGVDPGSEKSAFVWWDGKAIMDRGIYPNEEILLILDGLYVKWREPIIVAVESMITIPGGAGKAVIQTIEWADRFYQAWQGEREKVPVGNVRLALCGTMRSDNADVRRVLIQRFGEPGTKKSPGFIYGLQAHGYHLWRAFAVCVCHMDHLEFQAKVLK